MSSRFGIYYTNSYYACMAERESYDYYDAVIDSSDDTLICIGANHAGLLFLNELLPDTIYVPRIPSTDEIVRILNADPRRWPEWSWDRTHITFKITNFAIISETMRERAALSKSKASAIDAVRYSVNHMRSKINTSLWFQESIYSEKVRQARNVLAGEGDAGRSDSVQYVAQYAEHCGVPLRQAAEEILFQAQLDHNFLAKTEKIRMALDKNIRRAKSSDEIEACLSEFFKDGFV